MVSSPTSSSFNVDQDAWKAILIMWKMQEESALNEALETRSKMPESRAPSLSN